MLTSIALFGTMTVGRLHYKTVKQNCVKVYREGRMSI